MSCKSCSCENCLSVFDEGETDIIDRHREYRLEVDEPADPDAYRERILSMPDFDDEEEEEEGGEDRHLATTYESRYEFSSFGIEY